MRRVARSLKRYVQMVRMAFHPSRSTVDWKRTGALLASCGGLAAIGSAFLLPTLEFDLWPAVEIVFGVVGGLFLAAALFAALVVVVDAVFNLRAMVAPPEAPEPVQQIDPLALLRPPRQIDHAAVRQLADLLGIPPIKIDAEQPGVRPLAQIWRNCNHALTGLRQWLAFLQRGQHRNQGLEALRDKIARVLDLTMAELDKWSPNHADALGSGAGFRSLDAHSSVMVPALASRVATLDDALRTLWAQMEDKSVGPPRGYTHG